MAKISKNDAEIRRVLLKQGAVSPMPGVTRSLDKKASAEQAIAARRLEFARTPRRT